MRPGDQLRATFIGARISPMTFGVDPEGRIVDQSLGIIDLSGTNLTEARERLGAALTYVSTDYVFGGAERARPYGENDCPSPVNVYGASKAMGETLARLADAEVTVLRVASLFGVAGASGKGGNFVETMIRNGRDIGSLSVVDDITMSPTGTADVADMVLDLLEAAAPPGIYHAVNSGEATWC